MREPDDPDWGPPWARAGGPWRGGAGGPWPGGGPPLGVRVAGTVLLAVVQVVGSLGAQHFQPQRRPVDALALVLLLSGPAALLLLRGRTRARLLVVGALTATYLAAGYPYGPVFFSLAIALALSVVQGQRALAWFVAGSLLLVDTVTRLVLRPGEWSWVSAAGVVAWLLVVLGVGELVRIRGEWAATYRQAAQERRRRQAGEERLRIAQELHDVVAHHMSLINVQAGVALHLAERRPEQVEAALVAIRDASREALTELRSLIDVLRADGAPAPRAPAPSLAGIDDIVERSRHAGLVVVKEVTGEPRRLAATTELAAYRIVQEAITNIVRHAHATRATIALDYGAEVLCVQIEDNGTGASRLPDLPQGNGIAGMRERARALGGTLEISAGAADGLRVEAYLPADRP